MSLIFKELEYPAGDYLEEILTHSGTTEYIILKSKRRGRGGKVEFFFFSDSDNPNQEIHIAPGTIAVLPMRGTGRRPITVKGR